MTKTAVALLAIALAGTAHAAGWRSMRIDASSEASFNESVAALKDRLPRVRRAVLEQALQDIWVEGTKAAQAAGRDYTASDYLRELDGLKYKEVVEFTDPSGDTARRYFDQAYARMYRPQTPNFDWGAPRNPGWVPSNPPRDAGQGRGIHSPPGIGVNPWQK